MRADARFPGTLSVWLPPKRRDSRERVCLAEGQQLQWKSKDEKRDRGQPVAGRHWARSSALLGIGGHADGGLAEADKVDARTLESRWPASAPGPVHPHLVSTSCPLTRRQQQ